MARNIGPTAAGTQVGLALGLDRLPRVFDLFKTGQLVDPVDPVDGTLVAREPGRRFFDAPTRGHIRARDRRCRQPGCDLKIRDHDHIHAYVNGGPTVITNGQGLCKRSHTLKSLPGWQVQSQGKTTIWTTPTGHSHRSDPPAQLPHDSPGHLRQ